MQPPCVPLWRCWQPASHSYCRDKTKERTGTWWWRGKDRMPLERRDAKNKWISMWNSERFGEIKCTRQKAGGRGRWVCRHARKGTRASMCTWMRVQTHVCTCVYSSTCAHICVYVFPNWHCPWNWNGQKLTRFRGGKKWLNSTNDLDNHRFSDCEKGG